MLEALNAIICSPAVWCALSGIGAVAVYARLRRPQRRANAGGDLVGVAANELSFTVSELTQQLEVSAARIDARLAEQFERLDRSKREASECIAELRELLDRCKKTSDASASANEPAKSAPVNRFDSEPAPTERTRIRSRAERLARVAASTNGRPARPPTVLAGASDRALVSAPVCALADSGMSPIDIAQQTNMLLGEVELLLRLREFEAANSTADSSCDSR